MAPRYDVVATLLTVAIVGAVVGCSKDAPTALGERPGPPEAHSDITLQAIPANDDFDDAIVIGALPFTHSVNTVDATISSDDPVSEACGFGPIDSHTVWYEFTPAEDARINLTT